MMVSWLIFSLEKALIPSVKSEYAFRFELPPGLPPTYHGKRCGAEYVTTVRAVIPWWADAKADFDVYVSQPPAEENPVFEPVLFSSDPMGPKAREPHVEGSLASSAFVPGGVVEGALALDNVQWNSYTAAFTVCSPRTNEKIQKFSHRGL